MDRRSLIAGVVAAGIPAAQVAQDASPVAEGRRAVVSMERLVEEVVLTGSISTMIELVGGTTYNQNETIFLMADLLKDMRDQFQAESVPGTIKLVSGEDDRALALVDLGEPREVYVFLYLELDERSGLISGIRYSWHKFE